MKKICWVFGLSIICVLIGTSAFATNGMRMIGFGPIQNSMGGVSVGLPLDSATVLSNPAGMSDLQRRIDFGATYFKPSVEYSANGVGPGFIANNGTTFDSDRGPSPIPAIGVILPINDRLKFGIGAFGTCGMGVDYPQNLYGGVSYTSYSQLRFAPGLSFKINDVWSVGAAINAMYATMEYNVASGFAQQPHMGAQSFGYGATLGILAKPTDYLQIGLAYETKSIFQDFEFNTNSGKDKLSFDQPQIATIGIGVKPFKPLLLGVDVQWINWSQTNGQNLPAYSQNSSGAMAWNMDWEDQFVYKFGVQYTVNPVWTLRAGYNYGKMPLNSNRAFENIVFPAVSEHHFAAGVGINLTDHLALNLGGMYSPKAKISGANAGAPPAGQGIASYETSMSQYSIDAGLTYVF